MRRRREVGHLIQEQSPFIGQLKLAPSSPHTGRGAVLDTKESCLQEGFHECCAVDSDERSRVAATLLMDETRHQLLAGATLTFHQEGETGPRHTRDLVAETVDVHTSPYKLTRLYLMAVRWLDGRRRRCIGRDGHHQRRDTNDITQELPGPGIQLLWLGPNLQEHRRIGQTRERHGENARPLSDDHGLAGARVLTN